MFKYISTAIVIMLLALFVVCLRTPLAGTSEAQSDSTQKSGARGESVDSDTAERAATEREPSDAPELSRGFDHEHQVRGVAFSSDGRYLVACGGPQVRLWDYQKGVQKHLVNEKNEMYFDVKFRPNSQQYVACTRSGKVQVFDLEGETVAAYDLAKHNDDNAIWRVAYSPAGDQIAAASGDKITYLWQPEGDNSLTQLLGHDGEVRDVVFGPTNAGLLATSAYDYHARVWDLEKREERYHIKHDATVVQAVDVSPDGKYMATAGGPGELVRLFELDSGREVGSIETGGGFEFHRVHWGPEGKMLAVSGGIFSRGYFSLWATKTEGGALTARRMAGIETDKRGAGIYALHISPDGKIVATGNAGGRVRLWKTGR